MMFYSITMTTANKIHLEPLQPRASTTTYTHIIARWIVLPLVNTPVTPNHLTTLRLVTGLLAAFWFSLGEYLWIFWGGFMFMLSTLLDRADGELARLSQRISKGGHWYDLLSDMVVNALIFVGVGFGLAENSPLGIWNPVIGLVAGLSVSAAFLVVFRLHSLGSHPRIAFNYPAGFDLDDLLFVIVIFAWLDALQPLLMVAVVAAPTFLLIALRQAGQGA
jgi:archaetidylinositol phosphate synthase